MSKTSRPFGILLLTVLELALATLSLLGAAATYFEVIRHIRWSIRSLEFILLILAIVELALAYGFWTGKAWAWTSGLVFAVLGIVFAVFSLYRRPTVGGIIYLLTDLVVICYLIQPRVHQYFSRTITRKTRLGK